MWRNWNPCSNPDDKTVKWYNCYGKQYEYLKKQKINLPYDSAIPLLGRYPKELKAGPQRNICISKLKVALL